MVQHRNVPQRQQHPPCQVKNSVACSLQEEHSLVPATRCQHVKQEGYQVYFTRRISL